jgi:uncharacterized protein (DUF1330 family)
MKKTLLLMTAGFIVGVGATQLLHAATEAPAYAVGLINVKDQAGYEKEFLPKAREIIKEHGGVYTARGFNKTTHFDGPPPPNRVVIIKFESLAAVKKWWDATSSFETEVGHKHADFQTFAVEGVEQK